MIKFSQLLKKKIFLKFSNNYDNYEVKKKKKKKKKKKIFFLIKY